MDKGAAGRWPTHRLNVGGAQDPGRGQLTPLVPLRGSSAPRRAIILVPARVRLPPQPTSEAAATEQRRKPMPQGVAKPRV